MQSCGSGEPSAHLPFAWIGGDTSAWVCRASAALAAFQGGLLQHEGCSLSTQVHHCSPVWRLPHWYHFPPEPWSKADVDTIAHSLPATLMEVEGTFHSCPRDLPTQPDRNEWPHPQAASWIIIKVCHVKKNRVVPVTCCALWCQLAWKSSAGVGDCLQVQQSLTGNFIPRNCHGLGSAATTISCGPSPSPTGPWGTCLILSRQCPVIKERIWKLVIKLLVFFISEVQRFSKHAPLEELPHEKGGWWGS